MSSIRLTWKYKFCMLLLFAAAYMVLYVIPNFFPLFPPHILPLWEIDRAVPFIPWTFIVYLSDYLLAVTVILSVDSLERFHAFARVAFTVLLISGFFFFFFPTTYPRPIYPPSEVAFVEWLMNLVGSADTPNNCFPSMHVALTGACAFGIWRAGLKIRVAYVIWSLLIFASTLTTKQHYFVDIIGGLLVTATAIVAERKWYTQERVQQTGSRLLGPILSRISN